MIIEPQELKDAWTRILTGRQQPNDHKLAILWLRQVQMEVLPMDAPTCAVQDHNGRRRLARELINFAVSDLDGPQTEPRTEPDDAAVERGRKLAASRPSERRPRGAARRVD
ncbi:MAG TPA: hypothetical protein VEZ16_00145 [Microvirga sp.]|nr:hypothetical protein [Microvirga sp.]